MLHNKSKSPYAMTYLEIRETIARDIVRNLDTNSMMDLFGSNPVITGTYSTPGGDVWIEIDYGEGRVYHLSLKRFTRRTTQYVKPLPHDS